MAAKKRPRRRGEVVEAPTSDADSRVGPASAGSCGHLDRTESAADAARGDQRCGFVALIGAPNVGKSTLINALVGTKVAIVSHKAQTTRALLRGIAIVGCSQLILVDTPGVFAPKRRLDRAMVASAWAGAHEADIVALILDAKRGIDQETTSVLDKLVEIRRPKILVVNKIDAVDKPPLLRIVDRANQCARFAATFMVSALKGDGVADVKQWMARHVPASPWHYPDDQITDAPLRHLAAEESPGRTFIRSFIRSCPIARRWRPINGKSARMGRCASSRPYMLNVRASERSCLGGPARPSRRSERKLVAR